MIPATELRKKPTALQSWMDRIVKQELKAIENTIIEAYDNGDTMVTFQTVGPSKAKLNQYVFTHIVKALLKNGYKVSNFRRHECSFFIGDRLFDISWAI